jgi:hypothetical protein
MAILIGTRHATERKLGTPGPPAGVAGSGYWAQEEDMANKLIGLIMALPLLGAGPNGAGPKGYKYWSAEELQAMAKTLAPKVNTRKVALESLGAFGADRALMVHREKSGEAELHENDSDLIVMVSGTAALLVGGTMPGSQTTAPGERRAASLVGGERQKLGPGDILHIPPKTPHQLLLEPGTQITYFTLKVKE